MLDRLSIAIIIAVLPKPIEHFLEGNTARAAEVVGIFGSAWATMQFVFSPMLGWLSDRFGRRPVVLLSNLGMGLDYVVMALAPALSWLFVGRLISGITPARVATAGAYIADVNPPEERAENFGIGFIPRPALGGILGSYNVHCPFWAVAAMSPFEFCLWVFHSD